MHELDGLRGGVAGAALSQREWDAIHALYERVWPAMPARLRRAEALGARWADHTTPFTVFERGRAIATVGVLAHPLRLRGEDVLVGGIHSVGTDPERRGEGHCRRALDAAVRWAEQRFELLKLSTSVPPVFAGVGFVKQPLFTFAVEHAGAGSGALRRLDLARAEDLALVRQRMAQRTPLSNVLATRDEGWLVLIDAALASVTASWFYDAPELESVLVAEHDQGGACWTVHDVIGARLPALGVLLAALPAPCQRVIVTFTPDRIAGPWGRERVGGDDALMLRGAWPELPAFGMPPLWEH
ncbi:MAG: GNAT family N-acetyltransferase [Myxococcales bacterium]|nr:GNAT family N-acetyltransferase [Myxococcales bacterium]